MVNQGIVGASSFKKLLKPLIVFRVLSALLINSYFQADEFWQCLEPAHYKAFGYGELTWEWKEGLRSYAFPFLFQMVYNVCKLISLVCTWALLYCENFCQNIMMHSTSLKKYDFFWDVLDYVHYLRLNFPADIEYYSVIYLPKVAMALIAAVGEYYTIGLIYKVYLLTFAKKYPKDANAIIKIALVLTLSNFFNCFFITRTFINSFEMSVTAIALYYWPWSDSLEELRSPFFRLSLFLSFFMCLQRPTNGLTWFCFGLYTVYKLLSKKKFAEIKTLMFNITTMGALAVVLNCCIDFYFYHELCFPVLKFIKFNVTKSLSVFYGSAPWHFHIAQSFPIINGYSLPLVIYGLVTFFDTPNAHIFSIMKVTVLFTTTVFSLIKHKEFRFLFPMQPLFMVFSTFSLFAISKKYALKLESFAYLITPIASVIAALVIVRFQETGVIQVIDLLHNLPYPIESAGFIMPCHSTPWQSHLHRPNINDLWAITCEPPLHLLEEADSDSLIKSYMDESDYLYDNIHKFIYLNFPPVFNKKLRSPEKTFLHEWPEYLIIFEHMDSEFMKKKLEDSAYFEYARFFNSWSHWDSRRSGDVIVYHKPSWK
ncbi:GPI mannosyltransferase 3 [Hanseniaspora osmophila]|uniref:Mannosyltransferase n=1 Tax=Hanseniaspora osmophila TaxID=56408 RepID=A0A1E5RNU2_9ASCO|nr:GPI mannosyltransferase 3 [Hanseniaspora osmophila]